MVIRKMSVKQSSDELIEHLQEQYRFLQSSARSYDIGFDGEAKRLATVIRILLHDTKNSRSLLSSLGIKKNLSYYDKFFGKDRSNIKAFVGVGMEFTNEGLRYVANNSIPENRSTFDKWWNGIVIIQGGNIFTRSDVILSVANKDGGAHVDPSLDSRYTELSRNYNDVWNVSIGNKKGVVENGPHLPIIRECANEILLTLKDQVSHLINVENTDIATSENFQTNIEVEILKKEILDIVNKESYQDNEIEILNVRAKKLNNDEVNGYLAGLLYNWGNHLGNVANATIGGDIDDLYSEVFEKFKKATDLKPSMSGAYNNWGNYIGCLASSKSGDEANNLYLQAFEMFKKAAKLNPDGYKTYNNWGNNLSHYANTKSDDQVDYFYELAFDKYKKSIEINPDSYKSFYNWGNNLSKYGETKSDNEAEEIYNLAIEKLKRAVSLDRNGYEAFNCWGNVIARIAKMKSIDEAKYLYAQAFDKFRAAISIKPNCYKAHYNWGGYLGNLAKIKKGKDSDEIYLLAYEKLKKATELEPDDLRAFSAWGECLLNQAKTKPEDEAAVLFEIILDKFKKAYDLGAGNYDLSCIYALMREKENALSYLNKSLKLKEVDVDYVRKDEDWVNFSHDRDFQSVLKRYK